MKHFFYLFFLCCIGCFSVFSQSNKIIEVQLLGCKKSKPSFLKSLLNTNVEATLDSLVLENDMNILKRLPSVSQASYNVSKVNQKGYSVKISIQENVTLIPELGFWTATNNQFAYKLGVYEYSFLGRNIAVGGFYQNNAYDTYSFSVRAPNLLSKSIGFSITHQNWKSEEPLFFGEETANYLYNNISTELLGIYQLNFYHRFEFGVTFFQEQYEYLSGATNPNVPQQLKVDKTLLKLIHIYENLKYQYHYLDGFKNAFYAQYVTTENDFQNRFVIAWNDFFYFDRIGERGNWANRIRIGFASNTNSPFAPFALDNNINIRGVGIIVDRGTASLVLNTEYRYTLVDKKWFTLQTNTFIDTGTWRKPGGELHDFLKKENIKLFSGLGLRFINKKIYNTIFRIDYGFSLKNNTRGLVFGIGQYF